MKNTGLYAGIEQTKAKLDLVGDGPPELQLTPGQPDATTLTLRAHLPLRLTLKGAADLSIHAFVLTISGEALTRDLSDAVYHTVITSATPDAGAEYRFGALSHVDYIAVPANVTAARALTAAGGKRQLTKNGSSFACGLDAMGVQLDPAPNDSVFIASPSSAAQVLVALADGTPLQSFPQVFDPDLGQPAASRDLAPQLSKVWPTGNGQVVLTLTSQTDGRLTIRADGNWRRTATLLRPAGSSASPQPELTLPADPFNPVEVEVPLGKGWKTAAVHLSADAQCTGGLCTLLAPLTAGRVFAVRVTEALQVAQGVRLRLPEGGAPAAATLPALHLSAVWLCLSQVPQAPQTLELRLVAANPDRLPDQQPVATWDAKLPADAKAYVVSGSDVWFRAPCPKPVQLDGSTVGELLYLVASGRGDGTLLCHEELSTDLCGPHPNLTPIAGPSDPPGRQWEGRALVSNLAVDRTWALQSFNCHDARWRFELELLPDAPAAPLLTAGLLPAGVPGAAQVPAGLSFSGAAFAWDGVSAGGSITLRLRSRAPGTLKLRVLAEEVS